MKADDVLPRVAALQDRLDALQGRMDTLADSLEQAADLLEQVRKERDRHKAIAEMEWRTDMQTRTPD